MKINQERIDNIMSQFHQEYGVYFEAMEESRIPHYLTLIAFGASTWQILNGALNITPSNLEAHLIDVDLNLYERVEITNQVSTILNIRIRKQQKKEGIDLSEAVKTLDVNRLAINARFCK